MGDIAVAVLEEKIANLTAQLNEREFVITQLVFEVGKGKNVSISKGKIREANKVIGSIDWQTMKSNGELRITVTKHDEGKNG